MRIRCVFVVCAWVLTTHAMCGDLRVSEPETVIASAPATHVCTGRTPWICEADGHPVRPVVGHRLPLEWEVMEYVRCLAAPPPPVKVSGLEVVEGAVNTPCRAGLVHGEWRAGEDVRLELTHPFGRVGTDRTIFRMWVHVP